MPLRDCSAAPSLPRQRSETGPSGKDLAQAGLATAGVPLPVLPRWSLVLQQVLPTKSLVWGHACFQGDPQVTRCLQWHQGVPVLPPGVVFLNFFFSGSSFLHVCPQYQSLHIPCRSRTAWITRCCRWMGPPWLRPCTRGASTCVTWAK